MTDNLLPDPVVVLRQALARAEEALASAQVQVGRYRQAIAVLEGVDIGLTAPVIVPATNGQDANGPVVILPTDSHAVAAERVLWAAKRPMHIKDLALAMIAAGHRTKDATKLRNNITGMLERSQSKPTGTFVKTGPAVYGLRKLIFGTEAQLFQDAAD